MTRSKKTPSKSPSKKSPPPRRGKPKAHLSSSLSDVELRNVASDKLIKSLPPYLHNFYGCCAKFMPDMQAKAYESLLGGLLKEKLSELSATTRASCRELLPGLEIDSDGSITLYQKKEDRKQRALVHNNTLSAKGVLMGILLIKGLHEAPQPFALSLATKCTTKVRLNGTIRSNPLSTKKKAAAKAAKLLVDAKNSFHAFGLFLLRMKEKKELSAAGERVFKKLQALVPLLLTQESSAMATGIKAVRDLIVDLGSAIPEKVRDAWMEPVIEPVSGKEVPEANIAFLDVTCQCFNVGDNVDYDCSCTKKSLLPELAASLATMYNACKSGRKGEENVSLNFLKLFPYGNSGVGMVPLASFIRGLRSGRAGVGQAETDQIVKDKIKIFILFLKCFHMDSFSRHVCVEGRLELTRKLQGQAAPEAVKLFDALRVKTCKALHAKYWDRKKWGRLCLKH